MPKMEGDWIVYSKEETAERKKLANALDPLGPNSIGMEVEVDVLTGQIRGRVAQVTQHDVLIIGAFPGCPVMEHPIAKENIVSVTKAR